MNSTAAVDCADDCCGECDAMSCRWSATDWMRDPDHVTGTRRYWYGAGRLPGAGPGHQGSRFLSTARQSHRAR
jgi:hypothetical protein